MIKKVRIKNFKCYGDHPQDFNFSKINFIFGDNSTGKSTFLQALDLICTDYRILDKDYGTYVFKGEVNRTLEILTRLTSTDANFETVLSLKKENEKELTSLTFLAGSTNITGTAIGTAPHEQILKIMGNLHRQYHHVKAPRSKIAETSRATSSLSSEKFANTIMSSASIEYCDRTMKRLRLPYERKDRNNLFDTTLGVKVSLENVGAGIDNLIHLCDELYEWSEGENAGGIMVIEEPESHVNERQLSALTEFLVSETMETDESKSKDSQLFIECHSELMALALRNLLKHKKISPNDLSVAVITRNSSGSQVTEIKMDDCGNFLTKWPDGGFFTERTKIIDKYFR